MSPPSAGFLLELCSIDALPNTCTAGVGAFLATLIFAIDDFSNRLIFGTNLPSGTELDPTSQGSREFENLVGGLRAAARLDKISPEV